KGEGEPAHGPAQQGEGADRQHRQEAHRLDSTHALHRTRRRAFATATARNGAAALFCDSMNSEDGSESATRPAPACTLAVPREMVVVLIAMARSRFPAKSK